MSGQATPLRRVADVHISNVDKKSGADQIPVKLVNYTDVYYGDRIVPEWELMAATATPKQAQGFKLNPGDVVITKDSESADDIGVAAFVERSAPDMVCGYHLAILRPRTGTDGRFLYWAITSEDTRRQMELGATGVTRFGLRTDAINQVTLRMPTYSEQRAIADYLDTETARIDALISKKRRLIDLLAEHRTALITQTVTKGLPPTAAKAAGLPPDPPLKPTGITWLGDIPTHWEVSQLRRFVKKIKTGTTPPSDQMGELAGDELPWFSPGDIGNALQMKPAARTLAGRAVAGGFTPSFPTESTLIVGIGATTGRVGHTTTPSSGNQQLTCIVGNERVVQRFLSWQLWTLGEEIRATVPNTTLPILNNEFLRTLPFVAPPLAEQRAIVEFLDHQAERIETVSTRVETAIERLQEYRTALITAVVTGKTQAPGKVA